ncbi:MAG: histidine phosphatase family protein [Cardiobacteriaceae bacterium]|nr:histidine phosphatase family protein [Cardiobacteriaceae bacterium]
MKQIYLVRHGQSESNAGGAAKPNAIIPLTALGQTQAEEVADWLITRLGNNIASIGVSEYQRTHETAQPFAVRTGLTPRIISNLHEFNYLSFPLIDGLPFHERVQRAKDFWQNADTTTLDGDDSECFRHFVARVADVRQQFAALPDGNHVFFTHGLWLSMLIWQLLSLPTNDASTMLQFRFFAKAIHIRNCEVFLLTLSQHAPPSISKVYTQQATNLIIGGD